MAASERPAKKAKLSLKSFQEQLRVLIGPSKTELFVQKSMLCEESEFFKSACNPYWESGQTNTITLDDEDPATFSIFLTWIYKGKITASDEYKTITAKFSEKDKLNKQLKARWMQLVQCYVLGEMLMAYRFKNAVIDLFFTEFAISCLQANSLSIIDTSIIEQVFVGTPQGSPLRRYLLDTCLANLDSDHAIWAELSRSAPAIRDFLEDMAKLGMKVFQQKLEAKCPWEKKKDEYHDHPSEAARYS